MKISNIIGVGATILVGCAASLPSFAVPASPSFFEWMQPDGTVLTVKAVGDEYFHFYEDHDGNVYFADEDGFLLKGDPSDFSVREAEGVSRRKKLNGGKRKINTSYPTIGKSKALVILVNFADNEFTISEPRKTFERMLNEEGFSDFGATGSARDYFLASSDGRFDITFDVYGPVQLPGNMAYYGAESYRGHDSYPEEMVINACMQLDDLIDFTEYDRDGDGEIDNVYIFYAGRGQASGGNSNTIWPHSADVYSGFGKYQKYDGVLLNHYAMSNELDAQVSLSGIGTFCHEFSHVLGLPDFYATTYSSSFTCGSWSVMDYGPYLNDGHTPPIIGAYERYALKWLEPMNLGDEPVTGKLKPLSEANEAYMLPTDRPNEYYIIENRQQTGWDSFIPGHGMLLWHIDYRQDLWTSNSVNNDANHLYVDIVEADDIRDERNRDGDSFPGTMGVTEIDDFTRPSIRGWSKAETGRSISRIREIDGDLYFEYCGGNPPLGKVEGISLTEITPVSATFTWKPVEDAEFYRVTLYEVEGEDRFTMSNYKESDIGNVTELRIDGLNYSTDYEFEIVAENKWYRSLAGDRLKFCTLDPTFELLKPELPTITEVGENDISISWTPLEGARSYEIMVFDRVISDGELIIADFSDYNLPEGWKSDVEDFYNSTAYSGDSGAPSLKFGENGNYLKTPIFDRDIFSVAVWHRGTVNTEGVTLRIDFLDNYDRVIHSEKIPVTRGSSGVMTVLGGIDGDDLLKYHSRRVTFTFESEVTCNLALDDIMIGFAGKINDNELKSLMVDVSDKEYPYYKIDNLSEFTLYNFKIRGIDSDGVRSAWSESVSAVTLANSLINEIIENSKEEKIYYDLFGRRIKDPIKGGFYITSDRKKIIF